MLSSDIDKTNMHEIVKSFVPAAAQETSVCCSARQTNGSKDVWFFWFAKCSLEEFRGIFVSVWCILCIYLTPSMDLELSVNQWIKQSINQSINWWLSTCEVVHLGVMLPSCETWPTITVKNVYVGGWRSNTQHANLSSRTCSPSPAHQLLPLSLQVISCTWLQLNYSTAMRKSLPVNVFLESILGLLHYVDRFAENKYKIWRNILHKIINGVVVVWNNVLIMWGLTSRVKTLLSAGRVRESFLPL